MVIEKIHGLQATCISLNDRFTMLATSAPDPVATRQRQRRTSVGSFINQNLNYKNRNLMEQIARRLEQQAKRRALRHRLGMPLRRFGSEGNLPGLRRSNSFGNLSQSQNIKNRVSWRQSNGNLSRSASFNNLAGGAWRGRQLRGYRRRGGGQRALRGRFGGGRQSAGRVTRVPQRRGGARGAARGARGASRGVGRGRGAGGTGDAGRGMGRGAGGTGGAGRGMGRGAGNVGRGAGAARPNRGQAMRGRGRGGITRIQNPKPVPTKEELDDQLDQYMASCKSTLDKELDAYMKNAVELE